MQNNQKQDLRPVFVRTILGLRRVAPLLWHNLVREGWQLGFLINHNVERLQSQVRTAAANLAASRMFRR